MQRAMIESLGCWRLDLSRPPAAAVVAGDRVGHVLPQLLIVREGEPLLDDGLVEAVARGHHADVGLWGQRPAF